MKSIIRITLLLIAFAVSSCKTYVPVKTKEATELSPVWLSGVEPGKKYKFSLKNNYSVVFTVATIQSDTITGSGFVNYKDASGRWHNWEKWEQPIFVKDVEEVRKKKVNIPLTIATSLGGALFIQFIGGPIIEKMLFDDWMTF